MGHDDKRIALVSGANKGIGLEIAGSLARAGLRVMLGARNAGLGEAAAAKLRNGGFDVQFVELDLTNAATLQSAATHIERESGRLDVLVNNAGITDPADGSPGSANLDAVRRIFETNFIGALALTQAMLPLLRRSGDARIVNVSSGLGSLTWNSDPQWEFARVKLIGYNASKAALNMLTVQLADELRDTSIKVNAADPGFTATDLNGHRGYQTVEQGAAEAIRLALLPADGPSGKFFSTQGENPW
ncbi:SDR family oxidoreductase [Paraburkholderia metrosideri]|jgi:NAD(P)-dependent dehydrogenase (short-subunit alcohol dehydrogenase family)|uniref:Cyclopentanol dehydrogenase n=1 Tax=Paraburkholderia metrosideri TaxID=580937 RepID=A0ABM8P439_9BURK|nr:SDR family oxidoreductase [Paraburkholderia metrosideri]CAD6555966.1 Cyclopentanol dehydrogenase [Paraburkholderia metrosideri]